jgi:hypothetical protein
VDGPRETEKYLRITSVAADIRNEHFLNTSQEHYRVTSLLTGDDGDDDNSNNNSNSHDITSELNITTYISESKRRNTRFQFQLVTGCPDAHRAFPVPLKAQHLVSKNQL